MSIVCMLEAQAAPGTDVVDAQDRYNNGYIKLI